LPPTGVADSIRRVRKMLQHIQVTVAEQVDEGEHVLRAREASAVVKCTSASLALQLAEAERRAWLAQQRMDMLAVLLLRVHVLLLPFLGRRLRLVGFAQQLLQQLPGWNFRRHTPKAAISGKSPTGRLRGGREGDTLGHQVLGSHICVLVVARADRRPT
jgi:hypothetical protein